MTQCIQNSILQKKPDRTSEMTLLSGIFFVVPCAKIGRVPYIKSTDCPLFLPGGFW